ncbi:uncharacterized protein Nmag_1727 [Natrialba magadii ATCC 43099]|uniref:Uncharacterized protein n=1 Tax=Natrialba magadii (strain ATCC 43099 / DSM 3394 / CCM 3739 / CIP 104546 / IAM 13178 / JCM 8861 / NBRC 102185 / NCIMB 2190 / MS3) TaxID=547559 RepID=D3SUP5_NATMM|nr:hypothetical protein [Natrialba magadii]ADD05303.1 uncharacterized protein Nmag_1727 [Natrialba magadii ATCC 43099]ELY29148.1 hypothetical protein C500_11710 [Natrialba magadii ATCC 43099]
MRALQHCDFCDSEAAGTFEVLPPELEPTDAEQRRVVLCPACKDRLGTLLEPLLARLRGEPVVESDGADDPSEAGAVERREQDTVDRAGREDENAPESKDRDEATSAPRGNEITFGASDAVEDAVESEAAPASETGGNAGTGPMTETASTAETETEPTVETTSTTETETEPATDAKPDTAATTGETGTTSTESTGETQTQTQTQTQTPSTPQAYPKVIRLLRNRELPMDRSAVESLAAGAYDLEAEQAEAIVDHALEQEEFTERGGQLHRA